MNTDLVNKISAYNDSMWMDDDYYDTPYSSIEEIIKSMNKKEAIGIIEHFIKVIKSNTYPNIAFGTYSGGFCTVEKGEDKDEVCDGDKRFYCWPSCNACASEGTNDGYGLLDKALKIIKGKNNVRTSKK